jgi:hypothetical protein
MARWFAAMRLGRSHAPNLQPSIAALLQRGLALTSMITQLDWGFG